MSDVFADGEKFIAEFDALLIKHGFPRSYIDAVRPVFLEGFLNSDEKPMWFDPDDPGKDVDES